MLEIGLGEAGEIAITGRLDAAQAPRVESFLQSVTESRILDLAGLDYISSAGLSVLLKAQKRLSQSGHALRVVNASRHIYTVFEYAGFDQIFHVQKPPQG